jgi:hypothetical protein
MTREEFEGLYQAGRKDGLEKLASEEGTEKTAGVRSAIEKLYLKVRPRKAKDAEIYFNRAQKLGRSVKIGDLPFRKKAGIGAALLAAAALGRKSAGKGKGEA